ncbi:Aspartic proteinase nepenthesin-1 [Ananas comosus]|nr:Aspartic proteinase nepenthesin-1 [Ananas comosus]
MRRFKMQSLLSSVLISFLIFVTTSAAFLDLRIELTHVDAGRNFTKPELLRRTVRRSQARAMWLSAVQAAASGGVDPTTLTKSRILVSPGEGEYLMDIAIGTPPLPFTAILDTGSDLIWTQCKPCIKCLKVPAHPFDPSKSSTYSALPCAGKLCQAVPNNCSSASRDQQHCFYSYGYGDGTSSDGALATETFTFGSVTKVRVPGLGFGCGNDNGGDLNGGSGIVGFGRNPLSLISQLGIRKFAYCFTPLLQFQSKQSTLFFGPLANIVGRGPILTTPLLQNPSIPTFYYVSLLGITVGKNRLKIPKSAFQLRKDGTGGVIVDSGTLVTGLVDVAYEKAVQAFKSYVKLPVVEEDTGPFELCFKTPTNDTASVKVPQLVFHFQGADMGLPRENYMVEYTDRVLCVNIFDNGDSSVIGNIQQHNMKVLFDLEKEKLSFAPAQCDKL